MGSEPKVHRQVSLCMDGKSKCRPIMDREECKSGYKAGKVIVIGTGTGRGLGRALAVQVALESLKESGYEVVEYGRGITITNETLLEQSRSYSGMVAEVGLDITMALETERMVAERERRVAMLSRQPGDRGLRAVMELMLGCSPITSSPFTDRLPMMLTREPEPIEPSFNYDKYGKILVNPGSKYHK